jgi:SPP1 family predicted phage head-tail adaptor
VKPQNVGAMRERVTVLRMGKEAVDGAGNVTVPWEPVRTLATEARHQSDREYLQSAGTQLETMMYFTVRVQPDLRANDRLRYAGVDYEVTERHPLDDYGLYERLRAVSVRAERGA